jgi:hypothetical protein
MSLTHVSLQRTADREGALETATPSAVGPDRVLSLRTALGNQALQSLVQSRLKLGAESDPEERETLPHHVRGVGAAHGGRPLASILGDGQPLAASVRADLESRFGADLEAVRIHTESTAETLADSLQARAFAAGPDIGFASDQYSPATPEGRDLITHEVAHTLQPSAASVLRRQPVTTPTAPTPSVTDKNQFKQLVLNVAKSRLYNNRYNLDQWHALVESQFTATELKAQVQAAEAQRLEQIAEAQGGLALSTFVTWTGTENPLQRLVQEEQIQGRWRACTGCHMQVYAWNWGLEHPHAGPEWQSPAQQLTSDVAAMEREQSPPTGTGPSLTPALSPEDRALLTAWIAGQPSPSAPAGQPAAPVPKAEPQPATPSGQGRQQTTGPGVGQAEAVTQGQVRAAIERIQPIVQQLGPDGYQVLPVSSLSIGSGMTAADVRAYVLGHIDLRQMQYLELIRRIDAGDVDYLKFAQVVDDLLPLASEDVRSSVSWDRTRHTIKEVVRDILIIGATIALLLLSVFPPTTALGLAGLTALETFTGGLLLWRGAEHLEEGGLYALGKGGGVFTPEQTAAAEMLQFFGGLDIVFGALTLGAAAGHAEQLSGLPRARPQFPQLPAGPQTFRNGPLTAVVEADGTVTITHANFPDQLMIVRGGNATLYQSMGPGGLRVLGEFPAPAPTPAAPTGPPLLGPGPAGPQIFGPGGRPPVMLGPGAPPPVMLGPGAPPPLMLSPGAAPPLMLGPGAPPPLMLGPGAPPPFLLGTGAYAPFPEPYDIFGQAQTLAPRSAFGTEALEHLPETGEPSIYVVDPISGDLVPYYLSAGNPYQAFNPAWPAARQWAALREFEQPAAPQPEQLLQGRIFEQAASWQYPVNQLRLQASGGRPVLDSYDPVAKEIISRKHMQLARDYWDSLDALQEFSVKYPTGAIIADTPYARSLKDPDHPESSTGLAGQRVRGRMILEVSPQTEPVPDSILTEARNRGITIRDTAGRTY